MDDKSCFFKFRTYQLLSDLFFISFFQLSAGLWISVYERLWLKEGLSACFQPKNCKPIPGKDTIGEKKKTDIMLLVKET
jgi:hypothetical protein